MATDFEKFASAIELAARRNGSAIKKSVWINEHERTFMSNAFLAFADEIATIIKDHNKAAPNAPLTSVVGIPTTQRSGKCR